MDLISCGNCGVALDKYRITEPDIFCNNDDGIHPIIAAWDGKEYKPTIECPVCKSRIYYHSGDMA